MFGAGQKLKRARTTLKLTYRDVEEASQRIAERHQNDEFAIALSRLSDIENKGVVPTLYRLYALCAVYGLDMCEVLGWYGVDVSELPAESMRLGLGQTRILRFQPSESGHVTAPVAIDPVFDGEETAFLSRLIRRWGRLPLALLKGFDARHRRYGFVGTEDWTMYPLIQPGSLVMIDETRRKIAQKGWHHEFDRPIYFLEHRSGFACGWCDLAGDQLIVQPHPASGCRAFIYAHPTEIEVLGQVTGVAMCLDAQRPRRVHSEADPAPSANPSGKAAVPLP